MIYRFGDVEIDGPAREVRRAGSVVETEPKVLDVLLHLIRHKDRVVTKSELLDTVWEGRAISESVMARAVHACRKLFCNPDAIKTFYGRGYRFVEAVAASRSTSRGARGAVTEPSIPPSSDTNRFKKSSAPLRSLLGRDTEIALASECLDVALGGRARTLTITGDAGIGKTALCEVLGALAEERGAATVWGRCSEVPGAPAYWPFIQLLRKILELTSPALREQLLDSNPDVMRLAMPLAVSAPAQAGDPAQARFRLFDSVTRFIRSASTTLPLMLVIDDLHCADTPSLLLFHFLVEQLVDARILVVAAYRDAEMREESARARWMSDLSRQPGTRAIALRGLDARDVAAFVERALGLVPDETAVDNLVEQTAGNPFYLWQLVPLLERRAASTAGAFRAASDEFVPGSVRDAIESHLSALGSDTRRTLEAASVIGRDFGIGLVAHALDVDRRIALEALQPALRARIIVDTQPTGTSFRFVHVLVRDALYLGVNGSARGDLHRRVGEALELSHAHDLDSVASELSYHFTHAAPVADAEKAVRYSIAAGKLALKRLAYEDAARKFEGAVACVEQMPAPDQHLLCDLLLMLASAHTRSGDLVAARDGFRRAADLARAIRAPERLAAVALELAPGFFAIETGVTDEYLVHRLEEALANLGGKDDLLRGRLLGRLAIALYWSDRTARSADLCAEASAIAERTGSAEARLHLLGARHAALWSPENLHERLEWADELTALSEQLGDLDALLVSRCFRIANLLEKGDMSAVREDVSRFRKLASAVSQPECLWMSEMFDHMLAFARGEFGRVEEFGMRSIELGRRLRHHNASQTGGVYVGLTRAETSRTSEIIPILEVNIDNYPSASWGGIYTMACMRAGDRTRARRSLTRMVAELTTGARNMTWLCAMAVLCETAAYLEAGEEASILYASLASVPRNYVIVGYGIATLGALDRYLGLASLAEKRWTDAIDHFDRAIELNQKAELAPFVAHSRRELSEALRWRNSSGDHARAVGLLEESATLAEHLGMTWLLEQIRSAST